MAYEKPNPANIIQPGFYSRGTKRLKGIVPKEIAPTANITLCVGTRNKTTHTHLLIVQRLKS